MSRRKAKKYGIAVSSSEGETPNNFYFSDKSYRDAVFKTSLKLGEYVDLNPFTGEEKRYKVLDIAKLDVHSIRHRG